MPSSTAAAANAVGSRVRLIARNPAPSRVRHGTATARRHVAQEKVDNHHHQRDSQHQLELGVGHRGANIGGAVGQQLHLHRFRQTLRQCRQHLPHAVGSGNDICAGLALNIHHDGLLLVGPCAEPAVFRALFNRRHVTETDRGAILIRNNQIAVLVRRFHLVVSGKRNGALRAVEAAFCGIDVGVGDGGAHGFAG